jgi:hypothetical protein
VLRVTSIYGLLLSGVLIAWTALMVPTYVLTSSQLSGAQGEGVGVEKTKEEFERAFGEIRVANTIMAQLRKESDNIPISEVIKEVVKRAPEGISFDSFVAVREGRVLSTMQVQGNAQDRMTLAKFKGQLEEAPLFTQAFIPISDLARDTDLSFVVTLSLDIAQEAKEIPTP